MSFFDDVTMNYDGKLQNGLQPADCICKQLKVMVYFAIAVTCITIGILIHFCCKILKSEV